MGHSFQKFVDRFRARGQHQKADDWDPDFVRDRHLRGAQSTAMIFLGASIFSLIAWTVFLGTIHRFDLVNSMQDHRQTTRLLMSTITAVYWLMVRNSKNSINDNPKFWNFLGLALTSLLITTFGITLTNAEPVSGLKVGPEPRLGTTVLIFTLAMYCVATPSKWLIGIGMFVAAMPILIFNAKHLSPVAQGSFINFVIGVHLIGMIVYSVRLRQDLTLHKEQSRVKNLVVELDAAAKHAEELSAAKTRLIAVVSHDLRQPLNSLALYNNLLKSRFGGSENVALNSITERVNECVSAMDGNLSRLQEIAQLQSRQQITKLDEVDLNQSLRRLESVFLPISEASGVTLKFASRSVVKLFVESNPERLFEILSNLVSNAIKFSDSNSRRKPWVLVYVRRVQDENHLQQVRIDVRDNGIGIDPIDQETIFDEYVQLNNPERRSVLGYGLGLSVVRELCRSLRGHRVQVRSRLGFGACFSVWVPVAVNPSQESAIHEQNATNISTQEQKETEKPLSLSNVLILSLGQKLAQAKVLLIEDDESLRTALTAQLQDFGASVRAYPSAKHALAATANDVESPTCIISDYWLPEPFDGLQTISKLREHVGGNVPALLISAATDIDPARLQSVPNLEFALKPVSANTLLSYVKKHHRLK